MLLNNKISNSLHDARNLLLAQFRVHRKRKHFLRGALGVRKVAGSMAERRVQRLEVQRAGVVNGAPDLSLREMPLQSVTLLDSNGVLVEDVFAAFRLNRRHDAGNLTEKTSVFGRVRTARALPA